MIVDVELKRWATPKQAAYLESVNLHGGYRAAARALGVRDNDGIRKSLKSLERRAAMQGYAPDYHMTRTVPDPFIVKGVSTYHEKTDTQPAQWVKATIDTERREIAVKAALAAMAEEVSRVLPLRAPGETNDDLCNLYTLTDAHVGLLASHREGGADWDLKIAENILTKCFEQMVMQSPSAKVGVINQQGDWLHFDSLVAVTPTSGHHLDVDSRYSKMVGVAIRILRRIVDLALLKHDEVHVILAEGNHDLASSVWLRHMFAALYENDPRVTIDQSELPYYVYQHGETMLAVHHGHMKKNEQLPMLFAAQFPKIWGNTTKRYAHCGHRHHLEVKEHSGMTVTQHGTLAARDAYAARGGWISDRQAMAVTYHKQFGQIGTVIVSPEMVG